MYCQIFLCVAMHFLIPVYKSIDKSRARRYIFNYWFKKQILIAVLRTVTDFIIFCGTKAFGYFFRTHFYGLSFYCVEALNRQSKAFLHGQDSRLPADKAGFLKRTRQEAVREQIRKYLTDRDSLLQDENNPGDRWWWWLHNKVNGVKATEWFIWKWLRW